MANPDIMARKLPHPVHNDKEGTRMGAVKSLEVEYLATDALIPYARNSRTHSDEQVAQIAGSIREFGFTNPVLIDEEGGIIAGHGRVLAATKLKLDTVPTIMLRGLSEAQRRAYVIADNKLALNAGWDFEMLAVELDELHDMDFNLSLLGFEPEELNELIGTPNTGALDDEKYTDKTETPVYEIKGDKPPLGEIYNTSKTDELIREIKEAELPEDVRSFLLAAASRHTVFNYEKIAEFYAHAEPDTQRLMEASALVLIDWNQAMENGYVKLTESLKKLSKESDDAKP